MSIWCRILDLFLSLQSSRLTTTQRYSRFLDNLYITYKYPAQDGHLRDYHLLIIDSTRLVYLVSYQFYTTTWFECVDYRGSPLIPKYDQCTPTMGKHVFAIQAALLIASAGYVKAML
jgi:hypothetical protein